MGGGVWLLRGGGLGGGSAQDLAPGGGVQELAFGGGSAQDLALEGGSLGGGRGGPQLKTWLLGGGPGGVCSRPGS